jgi:hypothetical protein
MMRSRVDTSQCHGLVGVRNFAVGECLLWRSSKETKIARGGTSARQSRYLDFIFRFALSKNPHLNWDAPPFVTVRPLKKNALLGIFPRAHDELCTIVSFVEPRGRNRNLRMRVN